MQPCGEYGGRVLRGFKGGGVSFIRDAILTPELVSKWPLANRRALHENGNVEWYGPPSEQETEAREAGKVIEDKKPKRGKAATQPAAEAQKEEKKEEKPAAPAASNASPRAARGSRRR